MTRVSRFIRIAIAGLLATAAASETALGEDRPPIVIADPSARRYRAALQEFARLDAGTERALVERLDGAIRGGLEFSGMFEAIRSEAFLEPLVSPPLESAPTPTCPNWSQIGADALIQGELEQGPGELRVEFRVVDVARGCLVQVRKRYRGTRDDLPRIGKAIADDVVEAFTGRPGVADTEIAFISNRSVDWSLEIEVTASPAAL